MDRSWLTDFPVLVLGRFAPVPGLVILRQTFVRRCQHAYDATWGNCPGRALGHQKEEDRQR
jgi:hypothetical protein